jgi:hypothetical protein
MGEFVSVSASFVASSAALSASGDNPFIGMLWGAFGEVKPMLPYFIGIVAFILALKVLEAKFQRKKRRGWQRRGEGQRGSWQPRVDAGPGRVPDAADQLRTVMLAEFTAQPLLNKSEARLFKAIDKMVLEARPDWQVMAQVSLGEILRSPDKAAYGCINSKRVDLLIVDEACRPLHAIEYQGGGHYKGAHATAARDAVKKEALRRAGIGYVEVMAGDTPAELQRVIDKIAKRSAADA